MGIEIRTNIGRLATMGEARAFTKHLKDKLEDLPRQTHLYYLTKQEGYALGYLQACEQLGIISWKDAEGLRRYISNLEPDIQRVIIRRMEKGGTKDEVEVQAVGKEHNTGAH